MDPNILRTSYLLIIMIKILILSQVPMFMCQDNQQYEDCGELFDCGNIPNILYPFWGSNRSQFCGHPMFELNCQGDTPLITIESTEYRVLEINNTEQFLTVARNDMWNEPCPIRLYNTSLNFNLFNYAMNQQNATLHYGCNGIPGQPLTLPNQFDCNNRPTSNSYFTMGDTPLNITGSLITCTDSVLVPVNRTSTQILSGFGATINDLRAALASGFQLQWTANSMFCTQCVQSGGVCGSNSSTTFVCHCADQSYQRTCNDNTSGNSNSGNQVPRTVGLSIAGAALLGIGIGWLIFFCRQRRKRLAAPSAQTESKDLPTSASNKNLITTPSTAFAQSIPSYPSSKSDLGKGSTYFGVQVFTYAELEEATDNFNSSRELGDGGFGIVYYGKLHDGRIVAVKRLYENNFKRLEQFMNEVEILTRLQHKNLVKLYGCTSKRSRELLLVYEYIPNGTVADHLHGKRANSGLLSWPIRLNIAIQSAGALAYLHASDIIHRDVKTNNILLDNDFHVKVADFGLSRLFPNGVTHVSTAPQGTPGYVDPEYYQCYQLTEKSDIYSFGVVLIELISSLQAVDTNRHRHDINLSNMAVNKIQNHMLQELVDPTLGFETNTSMRRRITLVAELAFRCLQQESDMRPSMSEVLEVLKGIQNEELNPQKAEVLDILVDDMPLLKVDLPPLSPDSDQRGSSSTPNSSG